MGDSQGDSGAADFYESGVQHSGKYFVLSFPYSNGGYLKLHYGFKSVYMNQVAGWEKGSVEKNWLWSPKHAGARPKISCFSRFLQTSFI